MAHDYRKLIADGKCAKCRQKLGAIFYRLRVDRGVIDVAAARRQFSLSMFLGSDSLAEIFSPETKPLVQFTSDVDPEAGTRICLCDECFVKRVPGLAALVESVNERDKVEIAEPQADGHP